MLSRVSVGVWSDTVIAMYLPGMVGICYDRATEFCTLLTFCFVFVHVTHTVFLWFSYVHNKALVPVLVAGTIVWRLRLVRN